MKYFIGLDLGTQSSKGMLFNPEGAKVAEANAQYLPDFPHPGWAEQDVNVWIEAIRNIIGKLLTENKVAKEDIGMLAFACQCGGMVPVDKDGNPLRKCILWLDKRAEDQCDRVRSEISDDESFKLIGSSVSASLRAMKIMWVREHEPEIYRRAAYFMEPGEFLVHYLTGERVGDYAHASITGLYDIAKREWSDKMSRITGIPLETMCPVHPADEVVGNLRSEAAMSIGLTSNTKIVVGTGDQFASTVGAGLVKAGNILNVMGTAEIIAVTADHVAYDPNKILRPHLHMDPKLWQIEQGGMISGAAVRWFKDNVARSSFDEMNELAAQSVPGSNGMLFFSALNGACAPVFNDSARGIFFGMTMSHTMADITRSVYEGLAYSFRDNIESIRQLGLDGGEVIAGGGGINSSVWMQIKSDVIGKPIKTLVTSDTTPLGAGMMAGVAQGNFANFEEAADKLVRYGVTYEPNLENKKIYDEMYGLYREMYFTNEPLFDYYKKLNK